jgi:subtilase family serine protease
VMVPPGTAPGMYHVIAVIDALDQQVELNEGNNVAASAAMPITLYRPDLVLTAVSIPATGAVGRPLAITHTVKNAGPAPAGPFAIRFYLSSDGALDAGDVLLGTRMFGGLVAGGSVPAVTRVTIPANTSAPATYQVIAVADALGQQTELDEGNNTFVSTGSVAISLYRPDLTLTALTTPASATAGRALAIAHTVKNAGPAPAGAFAIRFYLSGDEALDTGDVLLGTRLLAGLGAGASSPAVTMVTIPAGTPAPSSYRVIAVVDALGQQAETEEGNNLTVSAPLSLQ